MVEFALKAAQNQNGDSLALGRELRHIISMEFSFYTASDIFNAFPDRVCAGTGIVRTDKRRRFKNDSEYIRLLISQKPNDYPEIRKILKELINEVNRIGININQIVFNNNAGLYSKEDKTQLIAYMRKLNQKVDEAVVKIGNQ